MLLAYWCTWQLAVNKRQNLYKISCFVHTNVLFPFLCVYFPQDCSIVIFMRMKRLYLYTKYHLHLSKYSSYILFMLTRHISEIKYIHKFKWVTTHGDISYIMYPTLFLISYIYENTFWVITEWIDMRQSMRISSVSRNAPDCAEWTIKTR